MVHCIIYTSLEINYLSINLSIRDGLRKPLPQITQEKVDRNFSEKKLFDNTLPAYFTFGMCFLIGVFLNGVFYCRNENDVKIQEFVTF